MQVLCGQFSSLLESYASYVVFFALVLEFICFVDIYLQKDKTVNFPPPTPIPSTIIHLGGFLFLFHIFPLFGRQGRDLAC
jgi:hypothetical protein